MGRLSLFAAGIAAALLVPRAASAQHAPNDDDRARVHFQSAAQYYDEGRYEEAIPEFREAFRLSHRPEMLLNLANAAEHALRPGDAADAIDEYLRAVPNAADHEALQRRLARDREGAARMAAGTSQDTHDTHTDVPPPITPPVAASGGGLSGLALAGIVTLGVGAATGIVSLIVGLLAHDQYGKLEAECPMHYCPGVDTTTDIGAAKSLAVTSTVLTFVAAGIGVAGVVLLALGLGEHTEAHVGTASLELAPGPGDVGLGARLRW